MGVHLYCSRKSKTCNYLLMMKGQKEFFYEKKLKPGNTVIFSKTEVVNKKTLVQKIWWLMWCTLIIKSSHARERSFFYDQIKFDVVIKFLTKNLHAEDTKEKKEQVGLNEKQNKVKHFGVWIFWNCFLK